jgi:hypothetical protein
VREAGMKTCCGGIVGMGESRDQRAGLLQTLANLPEHPQSVPINQLVQVEGTPLAGTERSIRSSSCARSRSHASLMPASMVRLSAGRQQMDDAVQALCFFAGANSIFYGEKLLTTGNPDVEHDRALFRRLDLHPLEVVEEAGTVHADILETEARIGSGRLRTRLWLQRRGLTCSNDWPSRRPNAKAAQLLRRLRTIDARRRPVAGNRRTTLLSFCSNDYLGLAQHPQLIAAFKRVADAKVSAAVGAPDLRSSREHARWKKRWPNGPGANARCCSPPATWPTSA